MIKNLHTTLLAIAVLLGLSSASNAEYLIYLKGGHFIVADDCTFSTSQEVGTGPEAGAQPIFAEDCTKGKPEGQIFWSTINGHFGELNADDVYAIFGTKSLPPIKPSSATMPLEDYLITNRGESFVNAKVVEERGMEIFGLKRDELSRINRRGLKDIAPEHDAKIKIRHGKGLCPEEPTKSGTTEVEGDPAEFAVSEVDFVNGDFVGVVTNLSKAPWKPWIDVEVQVKGRRLGKFQIKDPNVLLPDDSTAIDSPVPTKFHKEFERLKDAEAGVLLCYRKIAEENASAMQSPK